MCVCALQEGVCVRQQGRLSLVGGGMVKRFGLPSLSYHQGCETQIKLSLFPSFLSSSIHPSLSHTPPSFLSLCLTFISSAVCLSLPPKPPPQPHFLGFLFVRLRVPSRAPTNRVCRRWHPATELIAFQNKKKNDM